MGPGAVLDLGSRDLSARSESEYGLNYPNPLLLLVLEESLFLKYEFFMSIASVLNTPGSRSICGILIRYFEMSVLSTGQRPDGLFYDVCNCIKVQCFKRKIFIPPQKKPGEKFMR